MTTEAPPDTESPAVLMRRELAACRWNGKVFDEVWQFAILRVTRHLSFDVGEQKWWRETFGEQRLIWKAAYEGRDTPDILRLLGVIT